VVLNNCDFLLNVPNIEDRVPNITGDPAVVDELTSAMEDMNTVDEEWMF